MKSIHHNKSLGLLIIRIIVGFIFAYHGYTKFAAMAGTIAFFGHIGLAPFWAYVVSTVELVGGISLIIGFGSQVAGVLLTLDMLVAVYAVHYTNGLIGAGGAELPLALMAVALGIAAAGPGRYSVGSSCGCPVKSGSCPVDKNGCTECGCTENHKA